MGLFVTIVITFQLLNIFAKSFILDVWLGPESVFYTEILVNMTVFSRLIHKENIIHLVKWERTAMIIGAEISSMIWKDDILRQMVCSDGFNLSRPDPGRREKINVNFFSDFFVVPQKVL